MKAFAYEIYDGPRPFAFLSCTEADFEPAALIQEALAGRGMRISAGICPDGGKKGSLTPEKSAELIHDASVLIFVVSEKSIDVSAFRNQINYAMSLGKPVILIKTGAFPLSRGLGMQLSNVPAISFASVEQTEKELLAGGLLTQELIGKEMNKGTGDRGKKLIFASVLAAAVLCFVLGAVFIFRSRIRYYSSPEYLLQDADGSEYLNISAFSEEAIPVISGMSFGTLDLSDGNFRDLSGIGSVRAEVVILSGNPELVSVMPLIGCEGLQTVKLSQDMLLFADDLTANGIRVIITE